MKKRINLLLTQERYQKRASYFHLFKIFTLIFAIVTIIIFTVLFLIDRWNNDKINNLKSRLDTINYDLTIKGDTQKQKYLKNRLSLISQIIDNSGNYQSYLTIVNNFLNRYQINNININTNKVITVSLTFKNRQSLLDFIDLIQSKEFRSQFTDIKINKFVYPNTDDAATNMILGATLKI